jgi:hypothetical protein
VLEPEADLLARAARGLGGRLALSAICDPLAGVRALAGLATVTSWHFVWCAAAGMETILFCLFTLALIGWLWRRSSPPTRRPPMPHRSPTR